MNMNLTKKIAHNTAIQFVGKAVSTLLGLIAISIMTRYLGVEKFGWYATAIGFLQFIGIMTDFGFTVITSAMMSEPQHNKQKLLDCLFSWRATTGLVIYSASIAIIFVFPYPTVIKLAVAILSISFFSISLNQIFIGYLQHKLQMITQIIGEVLGRIFLVIGLAFVAKTDMGFLTVIAVVACTSLIYTIYLWSKIRVKMCFDRIISKAIWIKLWPVALSVMFNAIYLQGDKLLLPLFVSQTDMGLYGAAYRVLDIVAQGASITMGIMMPLVAFAWSRKQATEFKKRSQMSVDLMALILLPMAGGIFALSTPIMILVGGTQFKASGAILGILCLAIIGIAMGMAFGHLNLAMGKQKQTMWIFATDAVLALVGYLLFIPRFGIWGAVWVSVIAEFYAGIGLLIMFIHYSKVQLRFRAVIKIACSAVIMTILVSFLPSPHVVASIIYGAIIYSILIICFNVISKQTITEALAKDDLEKLVE
ncbi:MAG: flippase [bacterium]